MKDFLIAVLVITTTGCGPSLREGTQAGAKYEIYETTVTSYPHDVHIVSQNGMWFTDGGSGRGLTFYDVRNAGPVDLCINFLITLVGDETNIGVWIPAENFVLRAGETRTQVAGFASGHSKGRHTIEQHVESWKAAADPTCTSQ